jgi:glycine/D-amino acid oxidase-like deaminating enzyme
VAAHRSPQITVTSILFPMLARFRAADFRPRSTIRSLWLEEALAGEPAQDAEPLPARTDVCIVGGGYTGLWTAIRIKERDPSVDVVIVEADICGGGASGRNGGFVMSSWSKFSSLRKLCGTDDALRYARAAEDAIAEIGRFCDSHAIDAQFRQGGWLWAATNESQVAAWDETLGEVAAAGAQPYRTLDPDEVAEMSGSRVHLAGIYEPGAGTVQPALLARGLARVARELGVRIVERTPVVSVRADPQPEIATVGGTIRADRLVLAVNAWAAAIPELRRTLAVIASDVVATEPIPERLAEIGWAYGLSISDSRRLVNYYRLSEDGRIVFGKGGGTLAMGGRVRPSFHQASRRSEEVGGQLRHIYPMLRDVATASSWRGPIDYSLSGLPFFCALDGHPEVLVGAGYSGNGVGPSVLGGRVLADMALGQTSDAVPEALQRAPRAGLPPEPFRYVGGLLVRAAIARKEAAEDRGRPGGRLTSAVASLDPTSFVDRANGGPPS